MGRKSFFEPSGVFLGETVAKNHLRWPPPPPLRRLCAASVLGTGAHAARESFAIAQMHARLGCVLRVSPVVPYSRCDATLRVFELCAARWLPLLIGCTNIRCALWFLASVGQHRLEVVRTLHRQRFNGGTCAHVVGAHGLCFFPAVC